jgi:hypothetical protein
VYCFLIAGRIAGLVKAVCYEPEGRGLNSLLSYWFFFSPVYLILPAALWPWGLLSL